MGSPCAHCATYGLDTHSFKEIGSTPRLGRIIYTCISKAKDYFNSAAISAHITAILGDSAIMGPWSWIIDCRDMKMKHALQIDVAVKLSKLLSTTYSDKLQMLYVVNPTAAIDTIITHILPLLQRDSIKYLRKIYGSPLDAFGALKREGIEDEGISVIIGEMRAQL